MDIHSKEIRSKNMAAIKSKNTKPELTIRKNLYELGFRYRIHNKNIPGKPDISNVSKKIAIFVNGCFWHYHKNCKYSRLPKTRKEWWEKKLKQNRERDKKNYLKLKLDGWNVIVIWECDIKNDNYKKLIENINNY